MSPLEIIGGGSTRPISLTRIRAATFRCIRMRLDLAYLSWASPSTCIGEATTTTDRGMGSVRSGYTARSITSGPRDPRLAPARRRVKRCVWTVPMGGHSPIDRYAWVAPPSRRTRMQSDRAELLRGRIARRSDPIETRAVLIRGHLSPVLRSTRSRRLSTLR